MWGCGAALRGLKGVGWLVAGEEKGEQRMEKATDGRRARYRVEMVDI